MEDLLKAILCKLKAIHSKLDSINSSIAVYSSDSTASEILEILKEMKQDD